MSLRPCPCGKTPANLCVMEGHTHSYAFVSGDCCGDWLVDFRIRFSAPGSEERMTLATEAWNRAPRKDA